MGAPPEADDGAQPGVPGTVYVYNLNAEPASLSTNGSVAGTIAGWDADAGYKPACLAVDRVNLTKPSGGKLKEDINTVVVTWLGATSHSSEFYVPYGPDDVALSDDLVCYLTYEAAPVFSTQGFLLKQNQLFQKFTF